MSESYPLSPFEPPKSLVVFRNPNASGASESEYRISRLEELLRLDADVVDAKPAPSHLANVNAATFVASDGGDGTVQRTIAAVLGLEPNKEVSPDISAWNHDITKKITYFALAGGNANNWALSATGRAANDPVLAAGAYQHILHWPLRYEHGPRLDRSNIAVSCLGVGSTAEIMRKMAVHKPTFEKRGRIGRLAGEALLSARTVSGMDPFDVQAILYQSGKAPRSVLDIRTVGLDFVKTRIYAKKGRTSVNMDDTQWQPLVVEAGNNPIGRAWNVAKASVELMTGTHDQEPIDFDGVGKRKWLEILNKSDDDLGFQADGEICDDKNEPYTVASGSTIKLELAPFPVHTLIVAPPKK